MRETQVSISQWATDTFGPASSNARVCARANEEMAELLRALTSDQPEKAVEEAADVVIVLYRLAERLGRALTWDRDFSYCTGWKPLQSACQANNCLAEALQLLAAGSGMGAMDGIEEAVYFLATLLQRLGSDLETEIDRKMITNRARAWKVTDDGHGYHVRPEKQEAAV